MRLGLASVDWQDELTQSYRLFFPSLVCPAIFAQGHYHFQYKRLMHFSCRVLILKGIMALRENRVCMAT